MGIITRIRIDVEGASASDVDYALQRAAEVMDDMLFLDASQGECVIERDQNEPEGHTAWTGRLNLHPNVAPEARQRSLTEPHLQMEGTNSGGAAGAVVVTSPSLPGVEVTS